MSKLWPTLLPGLFAAAILLYLACCPTAFAGHKQSPSIKGSRAVVVSMDLATLDRADLLCVGLSVDYRPNVRPLEVRGLRIYFDLPRFNPCRIPTRNIKGRYITRVSTGYHAKKDKVRIALKLDGRFDYDIQPQYHEDKSLFCIAVIPSPKEK